MYLPIYLTISINSKIELLNLMIIIYDYYFNKRLIKYQLIEQ